jgi:hypothetical protein
MLDPDVRLCHASDHVAETQPVRGLKKVDKAKAAELAADFTAKRVIAKMGGTAIVDASEQQKLRNFVKRHRLFANLQGIPGCLKHAFGGLRVMLELYHLAEQLSHGAFTEFTPYLLGEPVLDAASLRITAVSVPPPTHHPSQPSLSQLPAVPVTDPTCSSSACPALHSQLLTLPLLNFPASRCPHSARSSATMNVFSTRIDRSAAG